MHAWEDQFNKAGKILSLRLITINLKWLDYMISMHVTLTGLISLEMPWNLYKFLKATTCMIW